MALCQHRAQQMDQDQFAQAVRGGADSCAIKGLPTGAPYTPEARRVILPRAGTANSPTGDF